MKAESLFAIRVTIEGDTYWVNPSASYAKFPSGKRMGGFSKTPKMFKPNQIKDIIASIRNHNSYVLGGKAAEKVFGKMKYNDGTNGSWADMRDSTPLLDSAEIVEYKMVEQKAVKIAL